MNKLNIYIALGFLLSISTLHAQEVLQLNLSQCRAMALENSELIKIAAQNMDKASGEKTAAKSARFPTVAASAMGAYRNTELQQELYLPVLGTETYAYLPLDITIHGGVVAGVMAEQAIYAGGKINAGNKMASIGQQMAQTNKDLKQDEIIYDTDKAYYLYLQVKEKVNLAKEYQNLLSELVSVVGNSYETGMVNKNELLKVQVKHNEAALQLQQAETGLKLAQMSLNRLIGVDLYTQLQINDSIGNCNFDVSKLSNIGVANRKELQLMQSQVEIAEQHTKSIRGNYLPTVGVSAGYNHVSVMLADMDNFSEGRFLALASLKIPLTTFGERKGKMSVAKADYNIKQLELQQASEYLQLETEQARLAYADAFTRVQLSFKTLEQADENMRISDDNYSLGMETIVNLLEAKAEWQKAYSNKIDALTDFKVKESNLQRVSNTLSLD